MRRGGENYIRYLVHGNKHMKESSLDVSGDEKETVLFLQDGGCVEFLLTSQKIRIQHVRLILLLTLLIYLILYFLYVSKLEAESPVVRLFAFSFLCVFFLLFCTYFYMKKVQLKIEVYGDRVLYPSFYFWKKCLFNRDIFSVEDVRFVERVEGFIVGEVDGGFVVFDKNKFESTEEYFLFKRIITNVVAINNSLLDESKNIYVHGKSYSIYLVQGVFLIVWLGLVACFYFSHSIEYFAAMELGALTKSVREGEGMYRMFSTFFLHISAVHVLSNTVMFALLVDSLLRLVDTFRFLATFFFAAFIGSIVSLYLSLHEYVIGASGGIFGLFGAYCVVKFTKNLPGTVSQRSNRMVLAVIVLQVVTEYFIDGIDSYSHVGGFIAGALCMSVYLRFSKAQSIYKSTKVEKGLAVILTGAYGWGLLTFLYKVYV